MKLESFLSALVSAFLWRGLERATGLFKHVVIAASIGLSAQLDVFYMAIAILGVIVFSWASLLEVVAVPTLVSLQRQSQQDHFNALVRTILFYTAIFSVLLAIACHLAANALSHVALGFDAERREMLVVALNWLLPVVVLYVPYRFLGSVARANRKFSAVYQAEFICTLLTLVCIAAFANSPQVLLWSFSIGIAVALVFLWVRTISLSIVSGPTDPRRFFHLLIVSPSLLILQGFQYVYVLSDRVFISFLPEGSIGALAYGMTIVSVIPALIGLDRSFLTVAAEGHPAVKEAKFNALISLCIYLSTAALIFLLTYADALIQLLLERGVFSRDDTRKVAIAISVFAWMLLPLFLIVPLDYMFQVYQRVGMMIRRLAIGFLANIALSALFVFQLGLEIQGIALAAVISHWVMLIAGIEGISRLGVRLRWGEHLAWLGWMALWLSGIYLLDQLFIQQRWHAGPRLLVGGTAALLLMLLAGTLYPGPERKLVLGSIRRMLGISRQAA